MRKLLNSLISIMTFCFIIFEFKISKKRCSRIIRKIMNFLCFQFWVNILNKNWMKIFIAHSAQYCDKKKMENFLQKFISTHSEYARAAKCFSLNPRSFNSPCEWRNTCNLHFLRNSARAFLISFFPLFFTSDKWFFYIPALSCKLLSAAAVQQLHRDKLSPRRCIL